MACPLSHSRLVLRVQVGPGYFRVNTQHLPRGHLKLCYKFCALVLLLAASCQLLYPALDFVVLKTSSLVFSFSFSLSLSFSLSPSVP